MSDDERYLKEALNAPLATGKGFLEQIHEEFGDRGIDAYLECADQCDATGGFNFGECRRYVRRRMNAPSAN